MGSWVVGVTTILGVLTLMVLLGLAVIQTMITERHVELTSLQNQAMFDNHGYTEQLEALGASPIERVKAHYDIAITNVNNTSQPPTYSIQATAKPGSMQIAKSPLTINHLGQKSAGWYE